MSIAFDKRDWRNLSVDDKLFSSDDEEKEVQSSDEEDDVNTPKTKPKVFIVDDEYGDSDCERDELFTSEMEEMERQNDREERISELIQDLYSSLNGFLSDPYRALLRTPQSQHKFFELLMRTTADRL